MESSTQDEQNVLKTIETATQFGNIRLKMQALISKVEAMDTHKVFHVWVCVHGSYFYCSVASFFYSVRHISFVLCPVDDERSCEGRLFSTSKAS